MTLELVEAQRMWDPDPGWLNTASYGIPPRIGWDALQQALEEWRSGPRDLGGLAEVDKTRRVRRSPGWWGSGAEDVLSGSTVSAAMALIADSDPRTDRPCS